MPTDDRQPGRGTEPPVEGIDSLRVVRAGSDEERDRLLQKISGDDPVVHEMSAELSPLRPLARPQDFEAAHRAVVRAIEVLQRNGPRPPHAGRFGVFSVVPRWLAHQGIHFIVRSHLRSLAKTIVGLYAFREASSSWQSPEHSSLRRCRLDMSRVLDTLDTRTIGVPAFIFGGAVLTSASSALQTVLGIAQGSSLATFVSAAVLFGVLAVLSWVALFSAAVARRRIKVATQKPLEDLWAAVGDAGRLPRDDSANFAVYAIVLLVLSWFVVPFAVWLAVTSL